MSVYCCYADCVCLDTCHVFDIGYDIVDSLYEMLSESDSVIGPDRLKAVNVNESINAIGGMRDEHAKVDEGYIGISAFEGIINNTVHHGLPFHLETSNDLQGYADEIVKLKGSC